MSDRDLTLTLGQIVDFADEIAALLATRTRKDLDSNREFRRALEFFRALCCCGLGSLPKLRQNARDARKRYFIDRLDTAR